MSKSEHWVEITLLVEGLTTDEIDDLMIELSEKAEKMRGVSSASGSAKPVKND